LLRQLRVHFADAIVEGWEQVGPYGLPDPDDEHVLAAAVVGGAGALVTENLRDFPPDRVPAHLDVLPAAAFARDAVSVDPDRAARALVELSRRRRASAQTPGELLAILKTRYGMAEAAALIPAAD
jgi:hypothetical protein